MAFKDLDEFFDDTLPLPVGGKVYVIPAPSAATGMWAQRLIQDGINLHKKGTDVELDDAEELNMYQRCLGPVYDQMKTDGVSWPKIQHCGMTAFFWVAGNKAAAEQYWENGTDPEWLARTMNRATRRSGSKSAASSAAGRTTKPRASTSGTRKRS